MPVSHIKQLSNEVIGQIAAGEVVERPSAAIKELVENSMDAGATAITVEIRDGGLTMFRVVDNGSGIQPSDIRLAFARHATSKISSASDLIGVQTLGFRGEALASIAAVSKVTCTTRMKNAEHGISVQNNGGELTDLKEAACPEGTSFVIKDLFYNAPVRRKFLKKPSTETGYVSDLMQRLILSNPHISFRYIADGKSVYFSAGDGKLESAVMSVYGLQTLEKLYKVNGHQSGMVLTGHIGVGELSRGNRAQQTFVLNGRVIKSNLLTAALEDGCRQRVMIGRFPICILHLTMPFEATDVNVHPNKWEVRFQHEREIRQAVEDLVRDALQSSSPLNSAGTLFEKEAPAPVSNVKTVSPANYKPISQVSIPISPVKEPSCNIIYTDSNNNNTKVYNNIAKVDNYSTDVLSQPGITQQSKPDLNASAHYTARSDAQKSLQPEVPAAAFSANSFADIPVPKPVAAPVVEVKSAPSASKPITETLATPAPATPSAAVSSLLEPEAVLEPEVEQLELSTKLDQDLVELDIRYLGVAFRTYVLFEYEDKLYFCDQHAAHERILYERMLKACEGDAAAQMLLTPVIVHLTHHEYELFLDSREALLAAGFDASEFGDLTVQLRSVPMVLGSAKSVSCFRDALDDLAESGKISTQKRTDRIIQMACKHAVKGGEKMPVDGLKDLIRRMITDNVTPTCPHGRPLVIEVTQRDLEKRFGRIQK